MKLAIFDSNVFNLIQPTQELHYLQNIAGLEIVPARRAREEAKQSGCNLPTPLSQDRDAPAPMMTNNPNRNTNDPAVLAGPTRGMAETKKIAATVYTRSSTNKHTDDQEIIGSAVDLYHSRHSKYSDVYFISGDQNCCRKAKEYFTRENIRIEVLHAKIPPARSIPGIRTVQDVFRP